MMKEQCVHSFAVDLLKKTRMNVNLHCSCHGKECPHFPVDDSGSTNRRFHIEVAGSPCVPFVRGGAFGTSLGFLHPVTVPFYIWLFSVRQVRPGVILHECVPGFDPEVIKNALNCR